MSVLERLLGREHEKGFSIAPLRKRDLRHGILDIEAAAYPVGWSHNVFVSEIDQMRSGTRHYVVARQDGTSLVMPGCGLPSTRRTSLTLPSILTLVVKESPER